MDNRDNLTKTLKIALIGAAASIAVIFLSKKENRDKVNKMYSDTKENIIKRAEDISNELREKMEEGKKQFGHTSKDIHSKIDDFAKYASDIIEEMHQEADKKGEDIKKGIKDKL